MGQKEVEQQEMTQQKNRGKLVTTRILLSVCAIAIIFLLSMIADIYATDDPFRPFIADRIKAESAKKQSRTLKNIDIKDLTLTGIAIDAVSRVAVFEDKITGRFYSATIGNAVAGGGIIVKILSDRVIIEYKKANKKTNKKAKSARTSILLH